MRDIIFFFKQDFCRVLGFAFFPPILSLDRIIIISVMYYPQIHIQYVDFYGGGLRGLVFVFHTIRLINGCIFAIFICVYTHIHSVRIPSHDLNVTVIF